MTLMVIPAKMVSVDIDHNNYDIRGLLSAIHITIIIKVDPKKKEDEFSQSSRRTSTKKKFMERE